MPLRATGESPIESLSGLYFFAYAIADADTGRGGRLMT